MKQIMIFKVLYMLPVPHHQQIFAFPVPLSPFFKIFFFKAFSLVRNRRKKTTIWFLLLLSFQNATQENAQINHISKYKSFDSC